MPLVTMPADDILVLLGKAVLYFAEIEYWVNCGIIEIEAVIDVEAQRRICGDQFSKRLKRLRQGLLRVEDQLPIRYGQDCMPAIDFLVELADVAIERNDLLHGTLYSVLNLGNPDLIHRNVNHKTGKVTDLSRSELEKLTNEMRDYGVRLQYLVLNIQTANQAKNHPPRM